MTKSSKSKIYKTKPLISSPNGKSVMKPGQKPKKDKNY